MLPCGAPEGAAFPNPPREGHWGNCTRPAHPTTQLTCAPEHTSFTRPVALPSRPYKRRSNFSNAWMTPMACYIAKRGMECLWVPPVAWNRHSCCAHA